MICFCSYLAQNIYGYLNSHALSGIPPNAVIQTSNIKFVPNRKSQQPCRAYLVEIASIFALILSTKLHVSLSTIFKLGDHNSTYILLLHKNIYDSIGFGNFNGTVGISTYLQFEQRYASLPS